LGEFPIPFATNGWEAFPRITAAAFFSRDPDTRVINVGMYNSQVYGPLRANVATSRHLHQHWEKCRKRGVALEVAAVIGAVPAISFVAAADVPHGVSEIDIAGGLIGEPVEMVACETVDLEVPATAEVVIEGEIPTDCMDEEGPTGENRGHVKTGGPVHALHVRCVTHRRSPVWHDIICQFPPSESSVLRSVNCEGRVLALLQAHGISRVKDVAFHHCGSARHLCVVCFLGSGAVATGSREVWHTLFAVMSVDPNWPKVIIGVDEDIDPHDLESVWWAIINRHQPHRDVKILQGRGAALDESVRPPQSGSPEHFDAGSHEASAMLIDATCKWPNPPISLPRREYMERARDLWQQLGLPPLKPRVPWYGVSLGHWPEEVARLVELSEHGNGEEAARLVMNRIRTLDRER
jgi:4-hydroxy-3-polyprenylbenzoate decarboxylase